MQLTESPSLAPSLTPPRRERFIFWLAGIFALAFALRMLHLWAISRSGLFGLLMGDSLRYHEWAAGIAAGDWIGKGVFYQAPLYPYLLGLVYTIFGESLWAVRILQALMGATACVLLADAGRRLFSRTAGIVTGLLLALYAPAIFYDALVQKSALDGVLLALILWLLSRLSDGAHRRIWLGLGLALGALCLTRENALSFVPVLLLVIGLRFRRERRRLVSSALLFAAGLAVVLLPVAIRNLAVGGEFYLTTSQLGPNLYIGNNPGTDGTYAPLRFGHGSADYEQADATDLAQTALGRTLAAGEVSAYWVDRSLEFIGSEPGRWLGLLGRKFLLAWNGVETVDTEDLYTYADRSLPLRLTSLFFCFGVVAPLGVLGVLRTWSRRRELWVFHVLFAIYLLTLVAFYVLGRYRMPMAILLILFAGAGVSAIPQLLRARPRRLWLAPAAALIVTAAIAHIPLLSRASMRAVTESNLGNAFFRMGDREQTETHYREAMRVDPEYAQGHYSLGVVLQDQGRLLEASNEYYAALRINPNYLEAHNNLASVLQQLDDPDAAIEHYRLALQIDPTSEMTRLNLARALTTEARYPEAEVEYRALLERKPDSAAAWNGLGLLQAAQKQLAAAIPFFQRAIESDAAFGDAYKNLAATYDALGQPEEGMRQLQRAVAAGAASDAPYLTLAEKYRAQGQLDLAADTYRRALQADPKSAEAHNGLGVILVAQGRPDEGVAEYEQALALDDSLAIAHYNLANVYRARGRLQETVTQLERAVQLQPDFFEAQVNLGIGLGLVGRLDEALACHRRVVEMKPDFAPGHLHLANALFNQGKLDEAMASFERTLELDPNSAVAMQQLAWILSTHPDAARRNPARAVTLAERANEITSARDFRTVDTLAVAYATAGRYAEAIRTGEQALALAKQGTDTRLIQQTSGRIDQFKAMQTAGQPAAGGPGR
jgi:tetratricopeptide (TPR) repeat protein